MKIVAVLPSGQWVRLDGPIEVLAYEDDQLPTLATAIGISGELARDRAVIRRMLTVTVERGGGAHAQASGGSASVATVSSGYSVRVDLKPGAAL